MVNRGIRETGPPFTFRATRQVGERYRTEPAGVVDHGCSEYSPWLPGNTSGRWLERGRREWNSSEIEEYDQGTSRAGRDEMASRFEARCP
jgi:hypothetical protein